jgi:Flp pilus assembly protein TadD
MAMHDLRRWTLAVPQLLVSTCVLFGSAQADAQDAARPVEDQAAALLSAGQPGQAISLLKAEVERRPLDTGLRLWLARAYLDDGNDFWALRTLGAAAAIHPEDCNLPLWRAWIEIKQGALDQARALLQTPCVTWPPVEARRALLLAMVEQGAGAEAAARDQLDRARAARFAFSEDRKAIAQVQTQLDPGFLAPLSGRLDLAMGATTNARAGSPVDPVSQGNAARSLVVQATGSMRFVTPNRSWARLSLEAEARGLGYQAEAGRDLSYLMLSARPGVVLRGWGKAMLLGYRYESFLLAGGDKYAAGPLWFFGAHRGEWEIELSPMLTFFGGAGRRWFREIGRTRTELDGGVGGGFAARPSLRLVAALSGRYYDAKNDAYDLRGISLLLSAEQRFPRRWSVRAGVLASADDYPRSAGYFDSGRSDPAAPNTGASGTARRDLLLRLSLSAFAPPWSSGIKLGLTYEFAVRDSTAAFYDYLDHRVLAKLIWTFSADPWLPRAVTPVGHVPIDYGLGSAEIAERVQDLLRQGEDMQGSSSCRE